MTYLDRIIAQRTQPKGGHMRSLADPAFEEPTEDEREARYWDLMRQREDEEQGRRDFEEDEHARNSRR